MGYLIFDRILRSMTAVFFLAGPILAIVCIVVSVKMFNPPESSPGRVILDRIVYEKFLSWTAARGDSERLKSAQNNLDLLHTDKVYGIPPLNTYLIVGIAMGVALFVLSVVGCNLRESSNKMYVFAYLNFILLVIASSGKIYSTRKSYVSRAMKKSMELYHGVDDTIGIGFSWNTLMIRLGCCGANGYKDFEGLRRWPPTFTPSYDTRELENLVGNERSLIDTFARNLTGCIYNNMTSKLRCDWMDTKDFKTPMVCCKRLEDVFDGCHLVDKADKYNNNMEVGCAQRTLDVIYEDYGMLTAIFIIIISFLAVYLCLLVFVLFLEHIEDKDENLIPISITTFHSHYGVDRTSSKKSAPFTSRWGSRGLSRDQSRDPSSDEDWDDDYIPGALVHAQTQTESPKMTKYGGLLFKRKNDKSSGAKSSDGADGTSSSI